MDYYLQKRKLKYDQVIVRCKWEEKRPSLESGTRKSISSVPSNVYITEGFFMSVCIQMPYSSYN